MDKLDEVETEKAGSSDEEVSTKHIINSGTLEQGTPGSPWALLDFQTHKDHMFIQEPLLLDSFLGAEMPSLLKISNFKKSSFGVNIKVHINHQKKVL